MPNPHLELFYFTIRGRADIIRLVLVDGGYEFKETRIPKSEWAEHKSKFIFGQMPVLKSDGVEIAQSHAGARYAAALVNEDLLGRTPLEKAMVDMWYHQADDVYMSCIIPFYTAFDTVEQLFKDKWCSQWMAPFEKRLAENEYLANGKLTLADYHLFGIVEMAQKFNPALLEQTPNVTKHYKAMLARPGVQKFKDYVGDMLFTNTGKF